MPAKYKRSFRRVFYQYSILLLPNVYLGFEPNMSDAYLIGLIILIDFIALCIFSFKFSTRNLIELKNSQVYVRRYFSKTKIDKDYITKVVINKRGSSYFLLNDLSRVYFSDADLEREDLEELLAYF